MTRMLIAVATYNRPRITELALANLKELKGPNDAIVVYDDGSTAYDFAFLKRHADEVVRLGANGGIERLRARNFRDFVERYREFDLLYTTDNDVLHDPAFSSRLRQLYESHRLPDGRHLPVCIYNSLYHDRPQNIVGRGVDTTLRTTAPGVSQLYDREMADIIVRGLAANPRLESMYGYDYHWPALLHRPFAQSETSYLEHFARDTFEGGLHARNSGAGEEALADFERDRAINPTPYLQSIRPLIIDFILQSARAVA
ncbi:MAG TPA: glycosyltransferase [Burkholderiaceae bacterium]|nr:glycosyltransferase [Burkholderiaceae bacterium]